ncbi:Glutamyl-tRNA(Gln) amidotransferase subunit A [Tolypocladium ophioglossoides CBS 100239]|uniref:Glutamyl-tRNA(Gln) amidotransferase subunit A n=1 Tax=Tolypocladium ophioglossoides (strain CBS 100239) TaxID=1163406 RepID=A0A0L0MYV9_TOLOC|nr:Glutamyl-tRNA(Gln) amidotransferase subunit A [Tolypocladium ophioglossoides CBS 100239]
MQALITCLVAGSQYLIHPHKLGSIQETINPDAILPVTLLETHELFGDLEATLRLFALYDDVFVPEFGAVLVEKPGPDAADHRRDASRLLDKELYRLNGHVAAMADVARLPSGPYFLHGPNLHQAWKLYDDEYGAFAFGVIPENVTNTDGFRAMASLSEAGTHKSIPVPSRLYHHAPNARKPLSGVRLAIPDALSLKGVQTALSSRAWRSLYTAPADATAVLAQRLLDLGAVIVGKSKSSQFASAREWVDEEAPWNPREDGYQRPLGGAAGAATAMAGYEWLKTAFGLDGFGEVRETAAAQGLYSLRTTPGAIPLAGSQIRSPTYDSVGLVSRDVLELFNIASAVLNQSHADAAMPPPKRLLCPVDFFESSGSKAHKELASQFVATLENFLGTKAEKVDVAAAWKKQPPPEAKGQGLQEYINDAPFRSFCYEFYHEYDEFRKVYQDKSGHTPYAEATTKHRWDVGKPVTKQDYDTFQQRIGVFRKWFGDNIAPTAESRDSWTAMVLPFDSAAPKYRDESLGAPKTPHGVTAELLPLLLQTPQMVVPFAQLPYESRISDREEFHPVYASVMGPKGADLRVIHLVRRAFETAQWRTRVDTGRFTFPVADNPRNVDDRHVPDSGVSSYEARTSAVSWGEL